MNLEKKIISRLGQRIADLGFKKPVIRIDLDGKIIINRISSVPYIKKIENLEEIFGDNAGCAEAKEKALVAIQKLKKLYNGTILLSFVYYEDYEEEVTIVEMVSPSIATAAKATLPESEQLEMFKELTNDEHLIEKLKSYRLQILFEKPNRRKMDQFFMEVEEEIKEGLFPLMNLIEENIKKLIQETEAELT